MTARFHKLARSLWVSIVLAALGATLAADEPLRDAAAAASPAPSGPPNIVVIQSDDQTFRQFRRAMPKTGRRLARHGGTTFTNYIASTAQCCPSRASLITGQYPHNNGVTSNNYAYGGLLDKDNVLPVWLEEAGYRTMHVGKFMNGYETFAGRRAVAPGWEHWHTVRGKTRYYNYNVNMDGRLVRHGHRVQDHLTHVLNRSAVRLVREYAPQERPFYLQLDEAAPRGTRLLDPYGNCDKAPTPQPRDEKLWDGSGFPRPRSFNEHTTKDKPAFMRWRPRLSRADRAKIRKDWRCALESLAGVDRGVANLYDAVRNAGELDRTVFIFTSDNGQFSGEHRIGGGKVLPYEEAIHLPLVIKVPDAYRDEAPRVKRSGSPVANIDLAPTILDLAQARPCAPSGECRTMDGRSLMPLLEGSSGWPAGRGLLTEYKVNLKAAHAAVCAFAGIRTRRQLYVEYYAFAKPDGSKRCILSHQRERYDLGADPSELHNRCFGGKVRSCPNDQQQLNLEARVAKLRRCAGIQGRDPSVSGRPFCE
jgi:N-acetylglucosamine-6-sulfatase